MCTHTRLIRNRYTGKPVRVSCGKCEACQQQKAVARANRIRNNSSFGNIALFITLTYKNEFVPYIRKSDFWHPDVQLLPIYRDSSIRHYLGKEYVKNELSVLDEVFLEDISDKDIDSLTPLRGSDDKDKVSVIYYKDLQDFFKRLRQTLIRKYHYEKSFSYFACAEYGSFFKRCHFHILLFVPTDALETFRSAVSESWSYADKNRTRQYIEIAKNAASYVSSYVCGSHSLPKVLQASALRQKHSYSKHFGVGEHLFSIRSIVEKVRCGNLTYHVGRVENGIPLVSSVPVPQYVINQFFPKFKGYSLLSDSEIRKLLLRVTELAKCVNSRTSLFEFTDDEQRQFHIHLLNIRKRFCSALGWDYDRFSIYYPYLYTQAWTVLHSVCLRRSYDMIHMKSDWLNFYENANEIIFYDGSLGSEFIHFLSDDIEHIQLDPNKRLDIVNQSLKLKDIYYKMDKNKRLVNYCMSSQGHNV